MVWETHAIQGAEVSEGLLELVDDLSDYYNDAEEIVINEEEELEIDNILNLNEFVNTLEDIIEDSVLEEMSDEAEVLIEEIQEQYDIIWDPVAEADKIIDNM